MRKIRNAAFLFVWFATFLACRHGGAPPASVVPTFYVLTTDSPFAVSPDQRGTVARARVSGLRAYRPHTFDMKAPGSNEPTHVVVTKQNQDVLITATVSSGAVRRSLSLRYPASWAVENGRLWLSPDYLHLDAGRACFAPMPAPPPTDGEIWVGEVDVAAVNRPGPGKVVAENSQTFQYRQRRGTLELVVGNQKSYSSTWTFQSDGHAEYTSRLAGFSGVLLEQSETLAPLAPGIAARAIERYYETDEM